MIQPWESFARDLAAARGEGFVREFCANLLDEVRAEETMAYVNQRKIATATQRIDQAFVDGIGECHFRIDPTVFFHWVRKEGRECWNDKQFIHEFKRDNPETIVRSLRRKTMIVRP